MPFRVGIVALIVAGLAFAMASPANAQRKRNKGATPTVERGVALYDDLEYEKAIEVLRAALAEPISSDEEAIEGYRALALSYLALGKEDKALEAFTNLLTIDRDYHLPATFSEQALELLERARASLPAIDPVPMALRIEHEVDPLQPKPGSAITITIRVRGDADDRHRRVVVFHRTRGTEEYSSVWAATTQQDAVHVATISGSVVQSPAFEYYLVAVDDAGNAVGFLGHKSNPLALVIDGPRKPSKPIYGKWWFWAGVGGAVVAGVLLAATLGGNDDPAAMVTVTVNPPAQ